MHILRLLKIIRVALRFGLDEFLLGHERVRTLRIATSALLFWRNLSAPRAERLRHALETLVAADRHGAMPRPQQRDVSRESLTLQELRHDAGKE